MRSKLNKDIISEILEYLKDDNSSLYSCLLINRTWCSVTIPLIWQDPFSRRRKKENSFKIVQTLISCLNEEEIIVLMNKIDNSLDFIMRPLFNYPSFIKEINFNKFERLIELHYNFFYTDIPTNLDLEIFTIQLLGNMIFSNKLCFIKKLIFNYNYEIFFKYKYFSCFENLIDFKGINRSLKYLESLKLNLYFPRRLLLNQQRRPDLLINFFNFFNNLSKITLNIKYLTIYLKLENIDQSVSNRICEAFSQLIKVQKNLLHLEINEFSGYSSLTTALKSQSHSLTSLKINSLRNFHILMSVLNTCTNLTTLQLTEYFAIEQDIITTDNLPQIHLENLLIYQLLNIPDHIQFISFIKSLLKLSYKIKTLVLEIITFELLDIIKLYHSNSLEYFSLQIFPNDVKKFCEILPSLHNLNSLTVIERLGSNDLPIPLENLILLANSLPITLKFLGIRIFCDFANFKNFLLNLNANIIELDIYKSLDDNFINVIIQYVLEKNRNLKRLRYPNAPNDNQDLMIKINELIPIIEETRSIKHVIFG